MKTEIKNQNQNPVTYADSMDRLESLLLVEQQEQTANKELASTIGGIIADTDLGDADSIANAEKQIVDAIPATMPLPAIDPVQLAKDFASCIVGDKTNAAHLRAASREDIHAIVTYCNTLSQEASKLLCATISRSQKHIVANLSSTSAFPAWVWLEDNRAMSLSIRFDAHQKSAVAKPRLEKSLQMDLLGALRTEQLIHRMLSECKASNNDDAVWTAAFEACLNQVAVSKTANKSILDLVAELKPRYETACLEQFEFLTRKGLNTLSLEKLEVAETLLNKANQSLPDVENHKTNLKQAVATAHADNLSKEQLRELEQKEITAILARLDNLGLLAVLKDYEVIKPKYGEALDTIDGLNQTVQDQLIIINDLKNQLSTHNKAKKAA